MEKKRKAPQMRFRGFEEEWEEQKVGDNAEIVSGGTPNTDSIQYWEPKQIPWMSSGEVNKKRLYETDDQISQDGLKNSNARWIRKNSVLIALAGQGKTRGTVAINCIPLTTNQSIAAIIPGVRMYYEFLFQNLEMRYNELRTISSGDGTRGGLNKQIISDIIVSHPSYQEQVEIGAFFQHLDALMALRQRERDKLITVKKAMLEKMFPKEGADAPEIRFKGFTGKWERRKLGETESYFTDGNYGAAYPSDLDLSNNDDGVPFLRGSNLFEGQLIKEGANYITKEKHNELSSGHLVLDDIVLAVRGSLGSLGYVKQDNVGWNINSQLAIIRTEKKELKGAFLIQYLFSDRGQRELLSKNTGTALRQLPIGQLREVSVPIVSIDEQTKIASFFQHLDSLIALQGRELEKLKQIKKACLEKMFA